MDEKAVRVGFISRADAHKDTITVHGWLPNSSPTAFTDKNGRHLIGKWNYGTKIWGQLGPGGRLGLMVFQDRESANYFSTHNHPVEVTVTIKRRWR